MQSQFHYSQCLADYHSSMWVHILWHAMKVPVYNSKPYSLDDLKMAIMTQFNAINSNRELCARVCESIIFHMTKCIEQNGWQFECLL